MTRRRLQLAMLLVGLVAVCLLTHPTAAAAQATTAPENQTNLLDTLQDLVDQLRDQRQDYYLKKAEDDAEIQQLQANAALLKTQLDELRRQEAQLDEQIKAYQSEIPTLLTPLASKKQMRRAVAQGTAAFVAQQTTRIEKGIPYKQIERLARLQAALADANEAISPSAADQLGHLWSYAQDELRLAGSSETYSDRASVEKDVTPYARYFRIGQSMLGYVTEDGQQTALWLSTLQGGQWQSILDPGQAAQVHNAVEILDRRQAPGLVSLPIAIGTLNPNRETP